MNLSPTSKLKLLKLQCTGTFSVYEHHREGLSLCWCRRSLWTPIMFVKDYLVRIFF